MRKPKQVAKPYEPWNNPFRSKTDAPWRLSINGRKDWRRFKDYIEFRTYIELAIKEGNIPPAAQIRVSREIPLQQIVTKKGDSKSFWQRLSWLLP